MIIFTFITWTSGCVIGVGIDSGLVAHWHLHWEMEKVIGTTNDGFHTWHMHVRGSR